MKNLLITTLILLIASSSFSQIKSAELTASGLTCSMCSKSIYKALVKVPFVKDVDANVETSVFTITFKPGTDVSLDKVKNAVEDSGFSVASLEVAAQFPGTEVANDTHLTFGSATYHFLNTPSQTLSGLHTFKVVDKNFLLPGEHSKYGQYTTMQCFTTGTMEDCCRKGTQKRVYHITLQS